MFARQYEQNDALQPAVLLAPVLDSAALEFAPAASLLVVVWRAKAPQSEPETALSAAKGQLLAYWRSFKLDLEVLRAED